MHENQSKFLLKYRVDISLYLECSLFICCYFLLLSGKDKLLHNGSTSFLKEHAYVFNENQRCFFYSFKQFLDLSSTIYVFRFFHKWMVFQIWMTILMRILWGGFDPNSYFLMHWHPFASITSKINAPKTPSKNCFNPLCSGWYILMQKANQKNRPSKSACFWLIKKSVFVCIRLAEKINFPSKIAFFNNLAYFPLISSHLMKIIKVEISWEK